MQECKKVFICMKKKYYLCHKNKNKSIFGVFSYLGQNPSLQNKMHYLFNIYNIYYLHAKNKIKK